MSQMETLFAHSQNIPAIPAVVHELIGSMDNPDVNIDELAKKISHDQALTAKVLRLANTAAYGGSRKIASLEDAVLVLGFHTLRTLVLSCGFVSAFEAPAGFDIKRFWRNSFRTAEISRILARAARQDAEVAFTCALLHDVGSMIMHVALGEQAVEIDKAVALGGNRASLESALLGYSFIDVGAELAVRWRFPETIVSAIRFQDSPMAAKPFSSNAGFIFLAAHVIKALDAGVDGIEMTHVLPQELIHVLKMDPTAITKQFDVLSSAGEDMASFLSA